MDNDAAFFEKSQSLNDSAKPPCREKMSCFTKNTPYQREFSPVSQVHVTLMLQPENPPTIDACFFLD
jgi:hypothetical protein